MSRITNFLPPFNPSFGGGAINPMTGQPMGPTDGFTNGPQNRVAVLPAVGRVMIGKFKEHHGILGRIAGVFDSVLDAGKLLGDFLPGRSNRNPLKHASDLLFHSIGILSPSIAGRYDVAQGWTRAAGGMAQKMGMNINGNTINNGAALIGAGNGFLGGGSNGGGVGGMLPGGLLGGAGLLGAGGLAAGGLAGGGMGALGAGAMGVSGLFGGGAVPNSNMGMLPPFQAMMHGI